MFSTAVHVTLFFFMICRNRSCRCIQNGYTRFVCYGAYYHAEVTSFSVGKTLAQLLTFYIAFNIFYLICTFYDKQINK